MASMLLGDVRQLPSWSSGKFWQHQHQNHQIVLDVLVAFWWLSPCDALNFQESLKHFKA